MGLNGVLTRLAVRRAHVLVVEVPGYWLVRAALEHHVVARGWRVALSAADADVLAVCGVAGPDLAGVIDRVWEQLPGPRARIAVRGAPEAESALDQAATDLLDFGRHRDDARQRAQSPDTGDRGMDDHGQMRHSGHGGMDHGGMDMAPAGIALATGGEDRDGLEMDVLHVRLGPVLAHWPAGLVVRCALQGDVIADAQAWIVDAGHGGRGRQLSPRESAARQADHVADLLALSGWPRAATSAGGLRDLLLTEPDTGSAAALLQTLRSMLRRSAVLRWSLRGLAPLTADALEHLQLPAALEGDTYDRLMSRVRVIGDVVSNPLTQPALHVAEAIAVEALPAIIGGLDLAAARLVIAGLGVDTTPAGEATGQHA